LAGVPDDRGGKVWRAWPKDVLAELIERTDHVHSE
jgi:hypothetical protein